MHEETYKLLANLVEPEPGVRTVLTGERPWTQSEARAAAWAHYWRRVDVWEVLVNMDAADTWPRCLTWNGAQIEELERWLAAWNDWMALKTSIEPTLPVPEVLRA